MGVSNADAVELAAIFIGNFTLDLKRQQLLRDGMVVELRPKSFDVLRYLAANPGRVVSKDEMFAAVWPGVTVGDDSLVQCISEIRQVLGEQGQALIRTMPRRGYMFVGDDLGDRPATAMPVPVRAPAAAPGWWTAVWRARTTRIGIALAAALCAGLLAFLILESGGQKTGVIRSVAILPFAQLTIENADAGTFGRGLTDLIVVRLSNLGPLKVHPTSAAASRLTQGQSALEIGRNLGVDAVLEGRVHRQHDRLRGTAQLLRVNDGETVWSHRFDEAASDMFRAQDDIALQIATSIAARSARVEKSLSAQLDSAFPEAMAANAKGRFLVGRRSSSSVEGAVQSFEAAIKIDRNFAPAYAGLAEALVLVGAYGTREPRQAFARAKEAALRALEIQPKLASPHTALAFAKAHADHDWAAAKAGYLRAIELAPSHATARQWLALANAANGEQGDALRNAQAALKLDPLSLIISVDVGRHLYYQGNYQGAIDQFLKTLELDPGFVRAHYELARAYAQQGKLDQAMTAARRAVDLSGRSDSVLGALAKVHASAGDQTASRKVLAELLERKRQRYMSSYHLAVAYAGLGETDAAIASLEQAYDERFNWTVFINVEPDFAALRGNPRFNELVRKMNLKSAEAQAPRTGTLR
jgi:DNA-binding winged helix-turn-helix (wHTH) protein/TolB-like protein/Tfp pilus assembly protein PilF